MPQRNELYSHLKQPSSLCSLVFHIRLFLLAPGVSSQETRVSGCTSVCRVENTLRRFAANTEDST